MVSVCCNVFIGVVYGSISGYYGGKVDMVMMRITEIINAFPRIVVVTLFIMMFGTGMFSIIMSLVIKDWVSTARTAVSEFYRFKGREYVLAARTLGVKDMALIFRHILPNSIGPIITSSMIAIPTAIFFRVLLGVHRTGPPGSGAIHRRYVIQRAEGAFTVSQPGSFPGSHHLSSDDLLQPVRKRPAGCL